MTSKLNANAPSASLTLKDVHDRVRASPALTAEKKKLLCAAIVLIGTWLGRPLAAISASIPELRAQIAKLHPARLGVSKKRFANVKADVKTALDVAGLLPARDRDVEPTPDWTDFLAAAPKPHLAYTLARFARFCSARGIAPLAVDDETVGLFAEHLDRTLLAGDPVKAAQETVTAFNAILRASGLARPPLASRRRKNFVTRGLDAYPPSFSEDLERYVARLEKPSLFDLDGVDQPLKPMTVRNIRAHARQVADAAVTAGVPAERFVDLAALTDISVLKKALAAIEARLGRRDAPTLGNILATILAIARYYVRADEDTIEKIQRAKRALTQQRNGGKPTMSEKSVERLAQFDDPELVAAFLDLPFALMDRAARLGATKRAAETAMMACALLVLQSTALRIKNLALLDLERHFSRVGTGGDRRFRICIPATEIKNVRAFEVTLHPEASRLVRTYLVRYRHIICPTPSPFLFPAITGKARDPKHLGESIKKMLQRELGVVVHPHLARHLMAKFFLEARPGEYESVRRMLGHAKMDTTVGFYAPLSTKAAFDSYHDNVLAPKRGPKTKAAKGGARG